MRIKSLHCALIFLGDLPRRLLLVSLIRDLVESVCERARSETAAVPTAVDAHARARRRLPEARGCVRAGRGEVARVSAERAVPDPALVALQLLQQRRTVDTPVCFTPPLLIPSREALARQDGAVQELLVVRRVPAAYKQCLAECVRR